MTIKMNGTKESKYNRDIEFHCDSGCSVWLLASLVVVTVAAQRRFDALFLLSGRRFRRLAVWQQPSQKSISSVDNLLRSPTFTSCPLFFPSPCLSFSFHMDGFNPLTADLVFLFIHGHCCIIPGRLSPQQLTPLWQISSWRVTGFSIKKRNGDKNRLVCISELQRWPQISHHISRWSETAPFVGHYDLHYATITQQTQSWVWGRERGTQFIWLCCRRTEDTRETEEWSRVHTPFDHYIQIKTFTSIHHSGK